MTSATALTLAASVLVAGLGYVATYFYSLKLARRKDRLERISRQLSELYGPLLATATAGLAVWNAFLSQHRPTTRDWWVDTDPPSDEELAAFRLWVAEVLQPLNEQLVDVIVRKADLLEEAEMPQCLLDVCAHVSAYKLVITQWQNGDTSEHRAAIDFPTELHSYLRDRFAKLKREQSDLIGRVQGGRPARTWDFSSRGL